MEPCRLCHSLLHHYPPTIDSYGDWNEFKPIDHIYRMRIYEGHIPATMQSTQRVLTRTPLGRQKDGKILEWKFKQTGRNATGNWNPE